MCVLGLAVVSINTLSLCTNLGEKTTSLECFLAKCVCDCACSCAREARLCMSEHKAKPIYCVFFVYCYYRE